MGLFDWARGIFKKRVQRPIDEGITEKAFAVVPAASRLMNDNISLWYALYTNNPPWEDDCGKCVKSIGLPAAICREFSRSALSEFTVNISGSPRADFLNEIVQNKIPSFYRTMELALALGGVALRPYMERGQLMIDVTSATAFSPIEFDGNGEAISGVFKETIKQGKEYYTRLEYHGFQPVTDGSAQFVYVIENKAYKGQEANGNEIPLESVAKWADIAPRTVLTDVERPLFAYFKNPASNDIEPESQLGVSVYGGSTVHLIEEADRQWERIRWEYESGERKIYTDGRKTSASQFKDRLFEYGDFTADGNLFEPFNPELRDDPLYQGFQHNLQRIEYLVGLSFGSLSDPQAVEKTATEILAAKNRQRQTVKAMQTSFSKAIEGVVYGLYAYCDIFNLAPQGNYEVTFNWGDGVLDDPDTIRQDKALDMSEIAAGIKQPWEYRVKWFKETPEEAMAALPGIEDLVTEPQYETE